MNGCVRVGEYVIICDVGGVVGVAACVGEYMCLNLSCGGDV